MDDRGADSGSSTTQTNPDQAVKPRKKRANMHEGIAVWCDCCSCEAEPYWVEIGKEMGIAMSSDYEDEP